MPRIHPKDFVRAGAINRALLRLLSVCKDVGSARNEYRWLHEHAVHVSERFNTNTARTLSNFLSRRARGEPLQYILSSEYFGDLEIKCRPGVLIPRPETAASVSHLVSLLRSDPMASPKSATSPLRILDLCTGTGCIPLLFHHEYYKKKPESTSLQLVGIDISSEALSLARENLIHQIAEQAPHNNQLRTRSLHSIGFVKADILKDDGNLSDDGVSLLQALDRLHNGLDRPTFDVVISNPPYISPEDFIRTTARSVRNYEPRLALVPPQYNTDVNPGDVFYPKLLEAAEKVEAKVTLLEVADLDQAKRVVGMAIDRNMWKTIEIWRDDPTAHGAAYEEVPIANQMIRVRGVGHGRSVFAFRDDAMGLLKESS